MKKRILLFLALGSLLIFSAGQSYALTITIDPSAEKIHPGDNLFVDINISGLHETLSTGDQVDSVLAAFSLDFYYDPSFLEFNPNPPAGWGPHLGDVFLGEAIGFVDDSTQGVIGLDFVSLLEEDSMTCFFCIPPYLDELQRVDPTDPTSPYLDTFTLATLGFYAPVGGASGPDWPLGWPAGSIVFATDNVVLSDPDGFEIALLDASGNPVGPAPVSTPNTIVKVPEPGIVALMSIGLFGLYLSRRQRVVI